LAKGIESFDKYMLWSLNATAVANIAQFGGRFRAEPIYVGNHIPPHYREVPDLMDRFFSMVHKNWRRVATHNYLGCPIHARPHRAWVGLSA
jgi:hypothetical protein